MLLRPTVLLLVSQLALAGCERSQAEKLAFQHAEEQYRINAEESAKYQRSKAGEDAKENGAATNGEKE
ncbi:hypothetical protein [Herbaspirillum sp. RV1423]|uniref:hypothetical protein n=1 Tax=Herbaspirillum sp. RV1423 TaxID=1443993 RepID=UPI000552698E|nr:hypothetical protein [Herbaspirillum sp. RV1423]